jgi:hypothetical protein
MRIISFDVGMKNLAYCVFSIPDTVAFKGASSSELIHQIQIERWDVIDLRFPPNLSGSAHTEAPPPPPPKRTCCNDGKLAKWVARPSLGAPARPSLGAPARPSIVAPLAPLTSASLISLDSGSPLGISVPSAGGVGGGVSAGGVGGGVSAGGVGGGVSAGGVGGGVAGGSPPPIMYCDKCAEKSKYKTPSREILPIKRKPELLQKKKLGELMDIKANLSAHLVAQAAGGPANLKLRKADLIQEITTTLARDYLEPFDEAKYSSYITGVVVADKPKKANYIYAHDLDLITYGRNMMKHLDAILFSAAAAETAAMPPIDMMIIENQISTLASRMKTLQGMITQYFIMKHIPQIEFISASCKLKLFTDSTVGGEEVCVDASTYADRKKSGIIVCRSLGEISRKHNSSYAKWMPVFENHKKKDDLADCFLQGLWRVHSAV